jgi:peptide/nickel transport system permease protein
VVRAECLTLRGRGFVESARADGAGRARIIGVHLLPNAAHAVIVSLTLAVARGILLESALSFFGVGVQPPQASWGNMLYQAQATLATEPWLACAPGLFILLTTLLVNVAGDRLARVRE